MPINDPDTQNRVKQYFRVKSRQLSASAELPVCEHPSLIGSHREELQRIYLREILPKRYEVGRGMIYGPNHRSKETDIVIWDSQNYPTLPMLDHSFFFAESVSVVLESKSVWKEENFKDVLDKCRSVHSIVTDTEYSLEDRLSMLEHESSASRQGVSHEVILMLPRRIGTGAIFLKGGNSLNQKYLSNDLIEQVDECWPNLVLLLEQGHVIIKNYEKSTLGNSLNHQGWLEFYDFGEDALLAFTIWLFHFLTERSTQVETPLNLSRYVSDVYAIDPISQVEFPVKHLPFHRTHLWRIVEGDEDRLKVNTPLP